MGVPAIAALPRQRHAAGPLLVPADGAAGLICAWTVRAVRVSMVQVHMQMHGVHTSAGSCNMQLGGKACSLVCALPPSCASDQQPIASPLLKGIQWQPSCAYLSVKPAWRTLRHRHLLPAILVGWVVHQQGRQAADRLPHVGRPGQVVLHRYNGSWHVIVQCCLELATRAAAAYLTCWATRAGCPAAAQWQQAPGAVWPEDQFACKLLQKGSHAGRLTRGCTTRRCRLQPRPLPLAPSESFSRSSLHSTPAAQQGKDISLLVYSCTFIRASVGHVVVAAQHARCMGSRSAHTSKNELGR